MMAWWTSLNGLEQGLACIAVPATLLLVVQTVLVLFSSFGDGTDLDGDGIDDIPSDTAGAGIQIFTLKGFVSFFCVFGWSSLLFLRLYLPPVLALSLGFLLGVACMFLMALAMAGFMKLQDNGNVQLSDALGASATVYLPIPAQRSGVGKVSAVVAGRYSEFDAITEDEERIPSGTAVMVIAVTAPNLLIVTRK